jgi:hypothetical protein
LQDLRATGAHLSLIGYETPNNAAAAWLDSFAKPLSVARAIGPEFLHFLRFDRGFEQAGGDEAGGQKADQHMVLHSRPAEVL